MNIQPRISYFSITYALCGFYSTSDCKTEIHRPNRLHFSLRFELWQVFAAAAWKRYSLVGHVAWRRTMSVQNNCAYFTNDWIYLKYCTNFSPESLFFLFWIVKGFEFEFHMSSAMLHWCKSLARIIARRRHDLHQSEKINFFFASEEMISKWWHIA